MPRMHDGYPCTCRDMYGRRGYILWDRLGLSMHGEYPCTGGDTVCTADGDTFSGIGYARACMMDIHVHVQVEICTADGDTFSGIGYARACMMDIHVQVEIQYVRQMGIHSLR
jgi:hypothetical protein